MVMRRLHTWLASALIVTAALLSTSVIAQPTPAPAKPDAVKTAQAAAQSAATSKSNAPTNAQQDFLTEQAKRAAQIRTDALQGNADFYTQDKRVAKQREEQATWLQQQQLRTQRIAEQSEGALPQWAGQEEDEAQKSKRPQYIVFVSQSMGEAGLKAAFEYGRGHPEIGYAFRGFNPGQSPVQFQGAMVKFEKRDPDQMVLIMLDPPSFTKFNVTSVPAIVRLDDQENMVAKVTGLINPQWLGDQVDAGRKGDLGNLGNTYAISELDLIAQMQKKAESLNLQPQIDAAKQRYFQQLQTIDLPYAQEQRVRKLTPVLTVQQDVVDQNGTTQWHKGQKVSLQDHLAATPVMVVFNSQDPIHVQFVKEMIKRTPATKKIVLMTTRIDRDGGLRAYIHTEYGIGRPVYLLTPDVQKTFGVERIPTVITPTAKEFVVVEVPLTQGVSGYGKASHPSP